MGDWRCHQTLTRLPEFDLFSAGSVAIGQCLDPAVFYNLAGFPWLVRRGSPGLKNYHSSDICTLPSRAFRFASALPLIPLPTVWDSTLCSEFPSELEAVLATRILHQHQFSLDVSGSPGRAFIPSTKGRNKWAVHWLCGRHLVTKLTRLRSLCPPLSDYLLSFSPCFHSSYHRLLPWG